jgi:Acetyltransferase (GNAT) domain
MARDVVTARVDAESAGALAELDDDESVDLVSIERARIADLPALGRLGFQLAPAWVSWIAEPGADEADYLRSVPAKVRYDLRRADRWAARTGLVLSKLDALGPALLAEFLDIYQGNVAAMRNGHAYARDWAERMLADPEFLAVCARTADGELAGASICQHRKAHSMLQIRFTARRAEYRRSDLSRLFCLRAVNLARELGCRQVSMGSDPALYGHLTNPGLFSYKARLGFRPVPMRTIDPGEDPDEVVRVHTLRRMTDPALLVAYAPDEDFCARYAGWATTDLPAGPAGELPVKLVIYSDRPAEVNATPYQASWLADVELRRPHLAGSAVG